MFSAADCDLANPDRLSKLLIQIRREGIDVCRLETYKRMSSAYNERRCLCPYMLMGYIRGLNDDCKQEGGKRTTLTCPLMDCKGRRYIFVSDY